MCSNTTYYTYIADIHNARDGVGGGGVTKEAKQRHPILTFNRAKAYSSKSSRLNSKDGTSRYMSTPDDDDDDDDDDEPTSEEGGCDDGRGRAGPATFIVFFEWPGGRGRGDWGIVVGDERHKELLNRIEVVIRSVLTLSLVGHVLLSLSRAAMLSLTPRQKIKRIWRAVKIGRGVCMHAPPPKNVV